jgi:hypothetical protein
LAAAPASAQAPADSLDDFLRELADSSDAYFGRASTAIDTTGLDSLAAWAKAHPDSLPSPRRRQPRPSIGPRVRYHRAEGVVLGAEAHVPGIGDSELRAGGEYGFSNQHGRYEFSSRRTLLSWGEPITRSGAYGRTQTALANRIASFGRYARSTEYFMPEHATPLVSTAGAFFGGIDRQSVFERRGFEAGLQLVGLDGSAGAVWRHARERAMPKRTDWSVWGAEPEVPLVTLADTVEYDEAVLDARWRRRTWDLEVEAEARLGAPSGRRLRLALAKGWRLGPWIKAHTQVEGGAADAQSSPQRRFELGGPLAVPSLGFGDAHGDHLLLGKLEMFYAGDLLAPLPVPEWLRLDGGVFVHGGAAWDDPAARDVVFSKPPSAAWRGSGGITLTYRPGIPDVATLWRLQYAWPIGPHSGEARFSVSFETAFDLLRKP